MLPGSASWCRRWLSTPSLTPPQRTAVWSTSAASPRTRLSQTGGLMQPLKERSTSWPRTWLSTSRHLKSGTHHNVIKLSYLHSPQGELRVAWLDLVTGSCKGKMCRNHFNLQTSQHQAAGPGGRDRWEPVWGKFHISNRLGDISEVAAAVTFLASNDAAFINATDLKVRLQTGSVTMLLSRRLMVATGPWVLRASVTRVALRGLRNEMRTVMEGNLLNMQMKWMTYLIQWYVLIWY